LTFSLRSRSAEGADWEQSAAWGLFRSFLSEQVLHVLIYIYK
jgi:hypothetical protein